MYGVWLIQNFSFSTSRIDYFTKTNTKRMLAAKRLKSCLHNISSGKRRPIYFLEQPIIQMERMAKENSSYISIFKLFQVSCNKTVHYFLQTDFILCIFSRLVASIYQSSYFLFGNNRYQQHFAANCIRSNCSYLSNARVDKCLQDCAVNLFYQLLYDMVGVLVQYILHYSKFQFLKKEFSNNAELVIFKEKQDHWKNLKLHFFRIFTEAFLLYIVPCWGL